MFLNIFSDPIYVILDYVNGGTLQTMLKKSRSEHNYRNLHGESQSLSSRDLTSFAYQVSFQNFVINNSKKEPFYISC
jgi:hypothetical protein